MKIRKLKVKNIILFMLIIIFIFSMSKIIIFYVDLNKNNKNTNELIDKVEETNNAVNLICSAVSALIDDSLLDNQESKQRLREIKNKLDNRKEIV